MKAFIYLAYSVSFLWLLAGTAYLALSGNFSSIIASGTGGLFILMPLVFHFWFLIIFLSKFILKFTGRPFWSRTLAVVLMSMILGDILIFIGTTKGTEKIRESKQQGDQLYNLIVNFKNRNGRLPESLNELGPQSELPLPFFSGTEFVYRQIDQESFYILFPSVIGTDCLRFSDGDRWVCLN